MLRCNPGGVAELLPVFRAYGGRRTKLDLSVSLDLVVEGRRAPDPVCDNPERGGVARRRQRLNTSKKTGKKRSTWT